jgi:hypothetical protein
MPTRPLLLAAALVAVAAALAAPRAGTAGPPAVRARLAAGELQAGVRASDQGAHLALRMVRTDGSSVELPEPGPRLAASLDEPTPVVTGGELAGLAWLEGATRESYAVRYAPWVGAGWGPVEEVAAPGAGSQLALAALPLADGRILAVWAGYDGQDDEILFALRPAAGPWSAPARVARDNDVPDITPALAATPGPDAGALVAWSRYDGGQYRVTVARFDGERFRGARVIGEPGTLEPGFLPPGPNGAPRLLYRHARPPGWTVADLDRSGAPGQAWYAATSDPARPTAARIRDGRLQLDYGDPFDPAARR